ncbi:MAG: class I SAM-dependent methyltransferase [Bacteroidota bacterium]|nr:class I SAM-dependent methyltransferase [Bacteroidota bacterium]
MSKIKKYIGYALPHILVEYYRKQKERKQNILRKERFETSRKYQSAASQDFPYSALINSLVSLGVDRDQIIAGSIPEDSLLDIYDSLKTNYGNSSILGLHIGNFVGVSLVYLTHLCVSLNSSNHIFSIDPNVPHRGIRNPQEKTIFLINKFGLAKNISILTGFSLEKNLSNDGKDYTEYDPLSHFPDEYSCENQLEALQKIAKANFSFVLIDGNHEKNYLMKEISLVQSLLATGGLIILDDVNEGWKEIKDIFESANELNLQKIFSNNRIGILKKIIS